MTQNSTNHGPKIALFEPDIPQNTAAIVRTCACLGAKLEIIEPCGFLLSDKRFKRVVMDYLNEKEIKFYQSSKDFFESKENQRLFLLDLGSKLNFNTPEDWYSISHKNIIDHGGRSLLKLYKSMVEAVIEIFPEYKLLKWKFRRKRCHNNFWS